MREKESGFRYTPTTCFETFPFPRPTPAQGAAIAAVAKELNELRERWLNPPEWTRIEYLEFPEPLALHLIVDNYATHEHPRVQRWLERHARFRLQFTPTSASWVNLVERWFRELTDKTIRRGRFVSVPDLIAAINVSLEGHNAEAKPFVWTASSESILAKLPKVKAVYETLQPGQSQSHAS